MSEPDLDAATAVVALMRGVVYREAHPEAWRTLESRRAPVSDHFRVIGVDVVVDEIEGFAYLRSRDDEESPLPRLVHRRSLTFPVSLLLVLLRRRLAEFEADAGDLRLVLDRDQIRDLLTLFLTDSPNEARQLDQIDTTIKKVVELGFLKTLRGRADAWEVRRVLKAYVDAQTIGDFEARLRGYRTSLTEVPVAADEPDRAGPQQEAEA